MSTHPCGSSKSFDFRYPTLYYEDLRLVSFSILRALTADDEMLYVSN